MTRNLPHFLHIGAAKSGSSWIYEVLREHPGIFVPIAKDVSYFDHQYDLGLDWYARHFEAAGNRVRGEVAHDYFLDRAYAERIREALPDVKLTACLREPVARIVSRYNYALSTEIDPHTSLAEYLKSTTVERDSDYLRNLKPFYELFPRENIRVFLFEEVFADPEAFCRELYDFLGVDSSFVPQCLHQRVRPARRARVPGLARLAWRTAKALRQWGKPNWVGAVKRNRLFNRLMFQEHKTHAVVPEEEKAALRERFAQDIPELERLLGRSVAKVWGY